MFNQETYFPHRMGARKDPKILCLRSEMGATAIAPYWDLVEILYEIQEHKIELEYLTAYAYDLKYDLEFLQNVVNSCIKFKLFETDGTYFWSNSVFKRIQNINEAQEDFSKKQAKKGRQSAAKRYGYDIDDDGYKLVNDGSEISNHGLTDPNQSLTTVKPNLTKPNLKQKKENEKKEEKEKTNKKEKFENAKIAFDSFRKKFGGSKRGLDVEFENFVKKTPDWEQVLPLLQTAIEEEIAHRERLKQQGKFVPEWKNLQTWINGKFWTQEFETKQENKPEIPYKLTMADVDYDPTNTHIYGGDGFNIRGEDRDGYNRQGLNEYGYTREQWAEKQRSKAS